MTNLSVFSYEDTNVRTVLVDGDPWFVAKDVLAAMKSSTTVSALKTLIEEALGDGFAANHPITDSLGREQNAVCLAWSAVTFVTSRSRTAAGKMLNRWIHTEVLPSIRKTGQYAIAPASPTPRALPRRDTVEYIEAAKTLDTLPDSTLKMLLRDSLVDELELQRNNEFHNRALPTSRKRYTIVKVRAKELGYSAKQIGSGSRLGMFVSRLVKYSHKEGIGRYSVNHFEVTHDFDAAIHAYFERQSAVGSGLTLVNDNI